MHEQQLFSLSEAAELVGKSRTTLWRAINSGKLSGEKGENDQWVVHLSELERVYKRVNVAQQFQKKRVKQHETDSVANEMSVATDVLQTKLNLLGEEKDRLLSDLEQLKIEMRDERKEMRSERDKLLNLVEQSQRQLTFERERYDDEVKRTRQRIKTLAQSKKNPSTANNNKILHSKHSSNTRQNPGLLSWLLGR